MLPRQSPRSRWFFFGIFSTYWEIIKDDMKVMEEFFEKGVVNKITNATFICLIPKKKETIKIGEFRPTCLVTSLYKIMKKVLSL